MTLPRPLPILLALAAAAALVTGCGSGTDGVEGAASTVPDTSSTTASIPSELDEFSLDVVDLDGRRWRVAVADERDLRVQGLMGVDDLGSLDGMLFVFDRDTTATFHMENTLIPLDIAFFTDDGALVSITQMVPCPEEPCPSYSAAGPYRYALEAREGALVGLAPDATLGISPG